MARKKTEQRSFNDVLALLGTARFDVATASQGAKKAGAYRVSKYGCGAEIAPAADGTVEMITHPGIVINGQIATLLDKGYQKFFATDHLQIAATADHLRSLHLFKAELMDATGGEMLYNQSLGTTSDSYQYDRVLGRK